MRPWQYRPAPPSQAIAAEPLDAAQEAELLHRHKLRFMDVNAHARLEVLFADPPADMTARLKKACEHLGVTGVYAELYALAVENRDALERLTARVEAGTWPIGNLGVLRDYLKRAREGDADALHPVVAYVMDKSVEKELSLTSPTLWRFTAGRETAQPGTAPPPRRAA